MAKKTNKTSHVLNLITGSQPPVASSGETQPSSSASGETQQEGSAAEEPVRVPSANVTVVDPREEGKLSEEIQKNLIRELEKEQKKTCRRAGRTVPGAGRTARTAQEQTKQTQEQPEQPKSSPNKGRDTCTGKTKSRISGRAGISGRAEAGRWSRLPGRKHYGGDPYSGTDP